MVANSGGFSRWSWLKFTPTPFNRVLTTKWPLADWQCCFALLVNQTVYIGSRRMWFFSRLPSVTRTNCLILGLHFERPVYLWTCHEISVPDLGWSVGFPTCVVGSSTTGLQLVPYFTWAQTGLSGSLVSSGRMRSHCCMTHWTETGRPCTFGQQPVDSSYSG